MLGKLFINPDGFDSATRNRFNFPNPSLSSHTEDFDGGVSQWFGSDVRGAIGKNLSAAGFLR
jgi:hypothetical protein